MVSFLRLATTFPAATGESLLSWLSRLCEANGISTSEFSSQIVGRDSRDFATIATRNEHAIALGCVTGCGTATIRTMMHSGTDPAVTTFFDQPIPWSALERGRRRMAAGQLTKDEAPFLRALWSIRVISCDPTSGERLIDRCTCGDPLWWRSMHQLLECSACGRDIRSIPAVLGSERQVEVSRFWASMYSFKPQKRMEARSALYSPIRDCDPAQLMRLAEHLGSVQELARPLGLESGTLLLKELPRSVDRVSPSLRSAIERTIDRIRATPAAGLSFH